MIDISYNLQEWINRKLKDNGWSIRELARRSELAPTTINDVLSQQSNPGITFCLGIARAFREPPERVFRMAGILPSYVIGDTKEEEKKELLDYFHYLPEGDRHIITTLARTLYEEQASYQIEKSNDQT